MVFFLHMILLDDRTGLTMSRGETAIVTQGACEPVCHAPRKLVVNRADKQSSEFRAHSRATVTGP